MRLKEMNLHLWKSVKEKYKKIDTAPSISLISLKKKMVNQLSEKLRQTIKPSSVESLLQFQPGNRFLRMKYY